jgi:hypothetical protein
MFSIQKMVQADIDKRNLVRQESVGTADDEADRRRQGNRVLDRFPGPFSKLASGGRLGR